MLMVESSYLRKKINQALENEFINQFQDLAKKS
jgi:hypothetical protein